MQFLRQILHWFWLVKWRLRNKSTSLDFYGEATRSVSARWNTEINPIITYHAMFEVLRQRSFAGNFIELGGGYSTIIARTLFDPDLVRVTSVDANPSKYFRILNSRSRTSEFLASIDSVSEPTVSLRQVKQSVPTMLKRIGEFDSEAVIHALSHYITDESKLADISSMIKQKQWDSVEKLFFTHSGFVGDVSFYESQGAIDGHWACEKIADSDLQIDALFLDCGEASSIAEFLVFEEHIKPGSFLLLHDIYYPKSIKNFLVAVYLSLNPDWELLYRDKVSSQGGEVYCRC